MTTPQDPFQPPAEGEQPATPPPAYGAPPPPAYGTPQQPPFNAPPPQYGAPQPGYGAPPPGWPAGPPSGYQPATGGTPLAAWGWRVLATIIDGFIIGIPAAIIGLAVGSRAVEQVLAIIGGLIIGYLNGAQGQSPGKRIIKLKVVRESDGQLIGGGMGIVRYIAHIVDSLACLIGWFWPLWDDKRQTFADKLVSTVVLKLA